MTPSGIVTFCMLFVIITLMSSMAMEMLKMRRLLETIAKSSEDKG